MAMKAGVSGSVRRAVFRRDRFTCQECGLRGWEVRSGGGTWCHHTPIKGVYLSIDHIVPKSRGGTHEPSNLRTLCTTCNTRKGKRPLGRQEVA